MFLEIIVWGENNCSGTAHTNSQSYWAVIEVGLWRETTQYCRSEKASTEFHTVA